MKRENYNGKGEEEGALNYSGENADSWHKGRRVVIWGNHLRENSNYMSKR